MQSIRFCLGLVIAGLALSGLTAFPLLPEVELLAGWFPTPWLLTVLEALRSTSEHYPFLAYGTDWLAFAHLVLALMFVGAYRDPVRNLWIIEVGLMACAGVLAIALICGPLRGIPLHWRLVDCSFGVVCAVPLWIARRETLRVAGGGKEGTASGGSPARTALRHP